MNTGPDARKLRQPSPVLATLFCVMVAVVSLYTVLPHSQPWTWLLLGLVVLSTAAFVVSLAGFALRQRDDYWRERGRDRKNPESPGTKNTSP
ncbi:hypothetical protein [Arthrobacter koreensis]|uniref:hypothetical protein n=1 Tax=Arthrobacter koreensis TaxID=199136 RepID=UPI002DBFA8CF|nr:hypothetical protein [Arthrobacter koreensis]MEB7504148.1 hypothetical protein [Arthrobacter koreensis]